MSDALLVGTHKGLFRLRRDGAGDWAITDSWFLGDPVSAVLQEADGRRLHAALNLGHFGVKLQRSDDGGASWVEVAAPSYPPKPEDEVDKDPMRGVDLPWSTQLIWTLRAGGEAGELWCGTIPGGLFRSSDGGDSWMLMRSLWDDPRRKQWMGGGYDFAGIHSVLVDSRDSRHVTVGVSVGGVWSTHDGGEQWALIGDGLRNAYMPPEQASDPLVQDVHCLAQCPSQPERVWMQHHNGIFRSDDGGRSWRELEAEPSSFGFAVVTHPTDPDTAWFVPAVKDEQRIPVDGKLVVTRTRDGGVSFESLDRGLPAAHAYDLVYRHALAISADGERLAFGSTTGNLWLSEDQGESWRCLSQHLPPVACVCFEAVI